MVVYIAMSKLILESSDCEILYLLKKHGSLSAITEAQGLDKGYLSRRLTKLSSLAPVLIRIQGKWQLTPEGQMMAQWYEESLMKQTQILAGKDQLVFGTTQTISERKLTAVLPSVLKESGHKKFKIVTQYDAIESSLLSGAIDFAFVCAIPQSPEIRFKRLFKWPYVIVMPHSWNDHFKNQTQARRNLLPQQMGRSSGGENTYST
jgi:DNA-binding transcriptional LysR family regulator